MTAAYPLTWPETIPRSKNREKGQFRTTLAGALENVRSSISRFGADSGKPIRKDQIVISSNVTLGENNPSDPGVAVWFTWDGMQVCIPVDRYQKVEANLQAIHLIIEARRTELRHGTLALVRATFTGFVALPPASNRRSWREVLGMTLHEPHEVTASAIEAHYRNAAKKHHPDVAGGSNDAMSELNRARGEALREIGGAT